MSRKRPVTEDGFSNTPKKAKKASEEFSCLRGPDELERTRIFIEKCRKGEIRPNTVYWDRDTYLEGIKNKDSEEYKAVKKDCGIICQIAVPWNRLSGMLLTGPFLTCHIFSFKT